MKTHPLEGKLREGFHLFDPNRCWCGLKKHRLLLLSSNATIYKRGWIFSPKTPLLTDVETTL